MRAEQRFGKLGRLTRDVASPCRRGPCLPMVGLAALLVSAVVAYLPHLLLGSSLDPMADFLIGSATGGVAYVATYYYLKQWLN